MRAPKLRERIQTLCPVPATAQRVIELTSRDTSDIREIAEAIALDASIAAELMRLANSALLGRRRKVDTLEQAVVSVGLRELHEMATAMGMLAAFASDHELSRGFHQRSLSAGSIARHVAPEIGLRQQRSVAFLAGLLSEVGAMGLLAADGEEYAELLDEAGSDFDRRAKLEIARYGWSSPALGAALLEDNGLPPSITEAVRGEIIDPAAALTSYVRRAAAAIEAVDDESYDAIAEGSIGDRLEAIAAESELEVDRLQLVLLTLEAAGVADELWRERVAC